MAERWYVGGLLLSALACGDPGHNASVRILAPADGAALSGPDINVILDARGVEIAPASDEREGTAHHHLFIDRDLTPLGDTIPSGVTGIVHLGRGQTEFLLRGLASGDHRVIAVLADRGHVSLSPPALDTVHFTLRP